MMTRILLVFLLAAVADPAESFAQDRPPVPQGRDGIPMRGPTRDTRERPAGTAVIRGTVVSVDAGAAIRRAQIRAVSSATRDTRLVTSDAQGAFELRDLPAGRWELTASKAGFVTMRFGQRRPFEAGRPIELADGQVVDRVSFALPRGAAITGRVLDEFGDPVAAARVQALRYQTVQGTRRLVPAGPAAQSDDTGAFRLYGLMPADYYVSATLRALPIDDSDEPNGYAPTYYPGTGSVTEAQSITLAVGQEASITFGLMPVRTARLSGRVLNSSGGPLSNGMVALVAADSTGLGPVGFGAGNRIRADGSFVLSNVAPGSYTLTATSGGPRGGADAEFELGSLPVVVAGSDLAGITVVTSRGATLSGTIRAAEGSTAAVPTTGLQVVTQAVPFERGFGNATRPGRVEGNGAFTLTSLFGSRLIRVTGLPQDWMLDSVIVAGADVTDTPVELGPNEEITDARIVVTNRVTEVAGTVTGRDGKPSREYTVVVFPRDEAKWTAPSRYVKSARPDQQGRFRISALPPRDDYLAVAVDYVEDGESSDPEFLEAITEHASKFRLNPGESATVNLKVVER